MSRRGWPLLGFLLAAVLAPRLVVAQPLVDELIVPGYVGPPWWIVSDGDTKVYILAIPATLPPDVTFDQRLLERRLTGANEVILPPVNAPAPVLSLAKAKRLSNEISRNRRLTLEPSLAPDIRARFVKLRQAAGRPATRYGGLTPGLAAMALAGDIRRGMDEAAPPPPGTRGTVDVIAQAARAKHVKMKPVHVYRGFSDLIGDVRRPGMPCLVAMLDDMEREAKPPEENRALVAAANETVRQWARGDIQPMVEAIGRNQPRLGVLIRMNFGKEQLALETHAPACLNAMPSQVKVLRDWKDHLVQPIVQALGKPGHAVAVVDAGVLLMNDGVLDRLRRQGFAIAAPDAAAN